ncbi:hypothetical protein RFI_17117 [Reticulomyxa filosa]|uniref:Dynein heavy chain n=1 Tax=Reticulomyxa filosa TaxID=46433 RepID=X6N461_RETFI|nr:hypothetical protein RFI_17117 [Reticulomyxa filosa]|eukprot:ETO20102.1 hypothetical protein RFI_17117 [Reticulomyxa filosa]
MDGESNQKKKKKKYNNSAAKLIEGLQSEKERWTIDKEQLKKRTDLLIGDCLLASSFLSYAGVFNFQFRKQMIYEDWSKDIVMRKIPMTESLRIEQLLSNEVERSQWTSEGLPSDELSVQNGILTCRASRYPLCIDPQMQAITWIKNREALHKCNVRTFHDTDFVKILELAIQFGTPFIFEGVDEEIDPIINNVLEQKFIFSGGNKQVMLGDSLLDWDDNFRLYLVTKLSNPQYSPDITGKTMIINFWFVLFVLFMYFPFCTHKTVVTQQGLEDQLLDVVVGFERPDLQKQREELIQTMSKNNIMLDKLENLLLKELTEATGNILENKLLIQTLQDAKSKSTSIIESQVESKKTAAELNQVASEYRLAAKRGSVLFFSMNGLSAINRMYEYSLRNYLELFLKSLRISKKDAVVVNRLRYIVDTLTKTIYDYTCTGIFEKHKLMYSFQMVTLILAADGRLNHEELEFFLKGNTSLQVLFQKRREEKQRMKRKVPEKKKPASWITDNGWKDLERLGHLGSSVSEESEKPFTTLIADICDNLQKWKEWYDFEKPEEKELPLNYSKKLTKLQELLVLRCFRRDRVYNGVRNFIVHIMKDDYFIQPPVTQFSKVYEQSSPHVPVVFILSKGGDPMGDLEKLAQVQGVYQENRFKYLALGQGQSKLAEAMLESGISRGHWVILQNCHLMPSWLKKLEKIIHSQLHQSSVNPGFRLWLTTDPTNDFPIGKKKKKKKKCILQSSLKVVTEPPDGLKLNMKASYSRVKLETLQQCTHSKFAPLVYVLSFFHAVVQVRRKYGKLGWNISYDFNESDYDTSLKLLSMYLNKSVIYGNEKIPWESLRYLIGEVMYGGRVTDPFDRRVLITYLEEYMGEFLFDDFQPFCFSNANNFQYIIPKNDNDHLNEFENTLDMYKQEIDRLPIDNPPQVFGLHSNAEIGYYTTAADEMWNGLISLQPRATSLIEGGIRREDYISNIAKNVLEKVPEPFDVSLIKKSFEDHAHPNPIQPTTVVLVQEIERWNVLVKKMDITLNDLLKALKGEISMNSELDRLSNDLFNGYLPHVWKNYIPDSDKKLGSWVDHFTRRWAQYQQWIQTKQDPPVIWLSGLHIPETYLAATLQTTCRKNKWPLDKSTLFTMVTEYTDPMQITQNLEDGCYVQGLYLEGAAWDEKDMCLCKQKPKQLVYELPILKIVPVEINKLQRQNTFRTPVYMTQKRSNAMGEGLVFQADLSSTFHPSHWILQGCALVMNISD